MAATDLFPIFTQSIKCYKFYYDILNNKGVLKRESSNRQKIKGCFFQDL